MNQCSSCGIKTKYLCFVNGGYSYLGKKHGKVVCFDCDKKLKNGKNIKWVGEPSKQTLSLIKKINELGYKVKPKLERTHYGYWQRASGAWVWYMNLLGDNVGIIGSAYTVKDIVNADKISVSYQVGNIELSPQDKKEDKK